MVTKKLLMILAIFSGVTANASPLSVRKVLDNETPPLAVLRTAPSQEVFENTLEQKRAYLSHLDEKVQQAMQTKNQSEYERNICMQLDHLLDFHAYTSANMEYEYASHEYLKSRENLIKLLTTQQPKYGYPVNCY